MLISVDVANICFMVFMVIVSAILFYSFVGDKKANPIDINNKFNNLLFFNFIFQLIGLTDCVVFTNNASNWLFYLFTFLYIFSGMVLTREYILFTISKFVTINRLIMKYKLIGDYSLALFTFLLIVFGFTGGYYEYVDGTYQRGPLYFMSIMYPVLACLFCLFISLTSKSLKRDKGLFFVHTIILLIGQVIQVVFVSFSVMAYGYCLVTLLFYVSFYTKARNDLAKVEEELSNDRLQLVQMQMQPHFMYNSLSSIAQLIKKDAKEAYVAINEFTEYLRCNLDAIGNTELVPFEKELRHTKSFAILEKYRFGDRINVVYDIGPTNFYVPALTIEPIVENSLRYGISKREEGGTVIIKTEEVNKYFYVWIIDDGDGYDVNEKPDTSRRHYGMASVKERLEKMIHGELVVTSVIGKGTKVLMKIPKEVN